MAGALSPRLLLEARDAGTGLHPLDRTLAVLRIAQEPDDQGDDAAEWPLPRRDRRLIALHRQTFGDALPCLADCPSCGERQEFDLSASAIGEAIGGPVPDETIGGEGWEVSLRSLTSRDLAAAARCRNVEDAASLLAQRAVAAVLAPADAKGPADLPAAAQAAIAAKVAEREAAADLALNLQCAVCRESWSTGFDIGAHLWAQVELRAGRLLGEVAALAERFGWSEAEILALPAARRRAYIAMDPLR